MSLYITPGGRVYHSEIGRFLQRDPLAQPGENPYVYANNNPLSHVDPSGGVDVAVGPITGPRLPDYFDVPGRYIFSLWCSGQGAKQETVVIANWGNNMMSDRMLTAQVRDGLIKDAKKRVSNGSWSYKGASELASNNWRTGLGMLHGADENAGGFQISGYAQVANLSGKCKKVTYFNKFDWYDWINPDPDNDADVFFVKAIKKVCTNAADYKVRVHWESDCSVVIDPSGNVKEFEGWPLESANPFEPSVPGVPCGPSCNVG